MGGAFLVIISGPPCSGKTTLGRRLAQEFGLPLVSRDEIKETLFDTLGWSDREWSQRLGRASHELLYKFVEKMLDARASCIIESNFDPAYANQRFLALKKKYRFDSLEVRCIAEGQVLFERFISRAETGARHPGHVEQLQAEEQKSILLAGRLEPLNIGGTRIEVDTTDFKTIDYDRISNTLNAELAKSSDVRRANG